MLKFLDLIIAAFFACSPFALIYYVAKQEAHQYTGENESPLRKYFRRGVVLTLPIWLSFIYVAACFAETRLVGGGFQPVESLITYLWLSMSMAWAIAMALVLDVGVRLSVLFVPVAFGVAWTISGIIVGSMMFVLFSF